MYLLIHNPEVSYFRMNNFTSHYVSINSIWCFLCSVVVCCFTSHYVSINSQLLTFLVVLVVSLHPTMYLLIPRRIIASLLAVFTLHPTMYLLILFLSFGQIGGKYNFTSHYVSINSVTDESGSKLQLIFTSHYVSINSLLTVKPLFLKGLYIPLCIY